MSTQITIPLSDKKGQYARLKVENKAVADKINKNYKNMTSAEFEELQRIAKNSGKQDVLENSDLSGIEQLQKAIKSGDATYSPKWLGLIGGNTIYVTVPKGTSMGTIKAMYHLPDGALADYCETAGCPGGDRDRFTTIANSVWFSIEDFAKGNNMTKEEAEKLFKKN